MQPTSEHLTIKQILIDPKAEVDNNTVIREHQYASFINGEITQTENQQRNLNFNHRLDQMDLTFIEQQQNIHFPQVHMEFSSG